MLAGTGELVGYVPAGLIDEQEGVRAGSDVLGDFSKMQVHRESVAHRKDGGPRPCLPWGKWRRRYRLKRFVDPWARKAASSRFAQRRVILFFWPTRASS